MITHLTEASSSDHPTDIEEVEEEPRMDLDDICTESDTVTSGGGTPNNVGLWEINPGNQYTPRNATPDAA